MRRSAAVAHQDDRATPNLAGDEVTRVGDFRFMAGIEPAPIKELGPLLFQDLRIGENAAIDAKDAARAIINDQVLHFGQIHQRSPHYRTPQTSGLTPP